MSLSRRSRSCEPKQVTLAIYGRKIDKIDLVSIAQVLIFFSCQLVSTMFHAIQRQRQINAVAGKMTAETADWSCELNGRYIRIYSAKAFPYYDHLVH